MQKVLPWKFLNQGGLRIKSTCHLTCWEQFKDSFSGSSSFLVLQGEGPFPEPETKLLSNTCKWIVWGDTYADKARDFIGKGHPGGEQEGEVTHENSSAMSLSLGFYGDGISFQVIFSQSFWLRVLPGGAHLVQPKWMPETRILGGGRTGGVSFWSFPNSSGWWWHVSSMFLTRTSCHKIIHANGYYGAWPGWAVSISVLPLTTTPWETSYSRYFLGIGAEVSFFCNFFLLCIYVGLPSRAEVSLYLI